MRPLRAHPNVARRLHWRLLALFWGLGGSACTAQGGEPLRLILSVQDDRRGALAEVPVLLGEKVVATSDAQGKATVRVSRTAMPAGLRVRCPEAYRRAPPIQLPSEAAHSVQLPVVCRPKLRTLAVVAYAPSARGTLLRADGKPLGRIGVDGTLHRVVRRAPGVTLRLTLDGNDTQAKELVVADRDQIIFFEAK